MKRDKCCTQMGCTQRKKGSQESSTLVEQLPQCFVPWLWSFAPGKVDGLKQTLVGCRGDFGIWCLPIEIDSLLHRIQERGAIRA